MPKGARTGLALILIMAFGLRLLYLFGNRSSPYFEQPIMDPLYHLQWAQAFAQGETFQEGPFFRAPLYPWFLGALLKVCGGSLFAVYVVQALLGTLSVGLVFELARRMFEHRTALVAASLVALNWVLIYFGAELLIPVLAIPLNLAGLLFTYRAHESVCARDKGKFALLAGLSFGLSAIARPNILLLMPFLFIWLLRAGRRTQMASWRPALLLTLGTLLPVLPLTAYNRMAGEDTVLISSQAGVNLWIGNNPQSDGSTAIVPGTRPGWWEGFEDSISLAEQAEGRQLKPSEVSSHYSAKALQFLREEPAQALAHLGWKLRLLLANWELGNNADVHFFAHHFAPWITALPASLALLLPLALIGLFVSRARAAALFPLWGFLAIYGSSIVLFFVCSRFRAPLLPVLAVPAGHALVLGFDALRSKAWKGLSVGTLVFGLLAALTLIKPPGVDSTGSMGHWALGIAELDKGAAGEAKAHFQAALTANPRNLYALRDLGRAHKAAGELLEACEQYKQALQLKPNAFETRSEFVDLLIARQELDEARQVAQAGLQHSPEFALSYDAMGRVLYSNKQWEAAATVLRKGLEREPTHFACNFHLGAILHETGDSCGAREYLRVAAGAPSASPESGRAQAVALLQVCEAACQDQ